MSAATKAKSAKARATIAARMMKRQKHFYRAFDDCFEMGDGREVMEHLIKKIENDPELALNIWIKDRYLMPRGGDEQSARFRQAVEDSLLRQGITLRLKEPGAD